MATSIATIVAFFSPSVILIGIITFLIAYYCMNYGRKLNAGNIPPGPKPLPVFGK